MAKTHDPSLDGLDVLLPQLRRPDAAPPPLREAVRARVGTSPAPVRPLWPSGLRLLFAAGMGLLVAGVLLAMRWPPSAAEAPGLPPSWWIATLGTWTVASMVLTWLALGEAQPRVAARSGPRLSVLLGLAAIYAAAAIAGQLLASRAGAVGGPIFASMCLGMGMITALAPAAILLILVARGRPFRPVRAGLLVGAAGAFWSLAVLETCPSQLAAHKIVSHLGVAVAFTVAGAVLGLILARRRSPA